MFEFVKKAVGKIFGGAGALGISMVDNIVWDIIKKSFIPGLEKTVKQPEVAESMAKYVQMHVLGRPDPVVIDVFQDAVIKLQTEIDEDSSSMLIERLNALSNEAQAYYKICAVPYPKDPSDEEQYNAAVDRCVRRLQANSALTRHDWDGYCNVMNFQRTKAVSAWEEWKRARSQDWEKMRGVLKTTWAAEAQSASKLGRELRRDIRKREKNRQERLEELKRRDRNIGWLPKINR